MKMKLPELDSPRIQRLKVRIHQITVALQLGGLRRKKRDALRAERTEKRKELNAWMSLKRKRMTERLNHAKKVKRMEPYTADYGRHPKPSQIEWMQDWFRFRLNVPLDDMETVRRYLRRVRVLRKKLKNAKGNERFELLIEMRFVKLRIRQTIQNPPSTINLDELLGVGNRRQREAI